MFFLNIFNKILYFFCVDCNLEIQPADCQKQGEKPFSLDFRSGRIEETLPRMPRENGTPHPDFHTNRLIEKNIKKEKASR